MAILLMILIIVSVILIIVSILMAPDATNISGALVGSADIDLFIEKKSRGAKKWFINIMFVCGILLLIISVALKMVI